MKFGNRTLYSGIQYRLLAFWDKDSKTETLIFATHGIIKKTSKVNKKEIDKADKIRKTYLKNKRNEKLHYRPSRRPFNWKKGNSRERGI